MKPFFSIALTIALQFAMSTVVAQPANDNCANAANITTLDGSCANFSFNNVSPDLANGSCVDGINNTWFSFTAQGPIVDITVSGIDRPEITLLEFFPINCDFSSATQITCEDSNGGAPYTTITLTSNLLVAGNEYYIIVTNNNNVNGTIDLCIDNPVPPPPPVNDEECNATSIIANGSCTSGTTISATIDWTPTTGCLAESNAVWYTVTLSAPNNTIDIDLSTNTFGGDVAVIIYTFSPNCNATPVNVNSYCGAPSANIVFNGLTDGITYYIQVSTTSLNSGNFDLCVNQSAPPVGCASFDDCGAPQTITYTTGIQVCELGCNTGSDPGPNFVGNNCQDFAGPTEWYSFTTGPSSATIDLEVSSSDFSDPYFTIFETTDCINYTTITCLQGTSGLVSSTGLGIATNTTYLIAVSSVGGGDGNFNLCLTVNEDNSACSVDHAITVTATSLGSPLNGPYLPDEIVTFCYDLTSYITGLPGSPNGCNYLSGIVPTFGSCWDPVSFNGDGMPANVTVPLTTIGVLDYGFFQPPCHGDPAGTWGWYPPGSVLYNLNTSNPLGYGVGDDVGSGWFFTTSYASPEGTCNTPETDPNSSYGDNNFTNCDDVGGWQVCFQLQTRGLDDCTGNIDCFVQIKTFADGEVGVWNNIGCTADLPITHNANLFCCLPPILDAIIDPTICSGTTTNISLTSNQDPVVSYSWTITADPGIVGAAAGAGSNISQTLTNTNTTSGTVVYSITADNGDCTDTPVDITVTVDPIPVLTVSPISQSICSGETSSISLSSNITGSTISWTVTSPPGISGASNGNGTLLAQTLTNSTSAPIVVNYSVTITGPATSLCLGAPIIIPVTVNPLPIILINQVNPASCNGLSDGSATATANGGTTPYTYAWDNGEITATAIGLNAGNHNVIVTDANNCSTTVSVSISQPTLLTANTALISNVSCNGATDGSASVTANGGTTPYTYAWDNGEITATAIGLNAGNHNVVVTDANNCSTTASVSISQPTLLTANTALISNVSCIGLSDGSASVTANGGTTPYTYAWDNGEITATAIGLNAGNHNVIVTDANNCSTTASVSISQPNLLTANTALISNAICNGATDGSASVTANGGTTPYTYAWDNGEITATAIGLNAGNHNVIVTDANNCSATASVSISQPTLLTANTALISNVSCNGATDGSASVTANGGTTPYTYAWDNGEITATAIGLNAGNHNVIVTDANNCSATASVSISQLNLLTANTALISNVSCNGATDGSASVTTSGGTTPYTYAWDNGEITAIAIGLNAGNHNVIVTDANNCSATASVSISQPTLLTANTALISNVSCNGATDGSANVTANGGTTPYTYAWDNGEITATAIGLNAGNHNVVVTDANNCSTTASVSISQPTLLTANTALISNVSCNGATDGSASVTANGGTTPYTYAWDNGEITATAIGLNAGNHNVIVTDANNCSTTVSVSISQPTLLTANTALISNVSCNGATDGSASVTANGGTTPYTYAWDNGEITATAIGLNAGNHNVVVTDANNCSTTASVSISQPTLLTVNTALISNVSCNGATDGSASVTANGGTTPYTYAWDNGEITATAIGLNAGNHNVIVTDANNCSATASVSISQPTLLTANTALISNVSCNGATDGSASVTANGGTTPYTYAWDNGEITATAIGLNAGNHNVVVTDANNCSATASVSISQPTLLTANTALISNVSCNGATDGSASVTANGGTTPYTYAWDNGEITATAIGLNAGNHNVIVTDANNCSTTASVSISQPTLLTANTALISNVSCNGATDGSASVTANGGTTPYTYAWDNGEITATAIGLNAGNHNVIVTDANNCSTTASVSISQPTLLTANTALISNVSCNGATDGSASVTANGGTTPYTYAWDNGEITATAIGLNAGNHNVIVTDANNCSATASVSISQPTLLTANTALISNVSCIGLSDGSASVTANGGTTPYTYAWDNGEITATAIGLNAGNHNVVVTDANNCSATASVSISQPTLLTANTALISNVSCNGATDGSASVTANGGTTPYTYAWDNGEITATAIGLNAGNHNVIVIDANNCSATASVSISQPTLLTANTALISNVSCNGATDGSASVTANGGTTPYTYAWDNGEITATAIGLNAGNHNVVVTDANNCSATASVSISQPTLLTANTALISNVSCNGATDGSASVTANGGTTPYTYAWDNGEITATAIGLNAGNHNVIVTDANNCSATASVSISQPALLTANTALISNVSCNGATDGSASVTANGGTTPYTYAWDNGEITATAIGLNAGNHNVVVTDANNCSATASVSISQPTLLTANTALISNVSCNGATDGSASVTANGGTTPYTYAWDNGEITATAIGLNAGNHNVIVTDANNCSVTASVSISQPTLLTANTALISNVSCNGATDGSASVTANGGTTPYTYAWDNGEITATAIGLNAGNHNVVVTDANNCSVTASVSISQPTLLTANTALISNVSCNGTTDGSASVTANGGTTPYTYAWDNGEITATAIGLNTGNHNVIVTDANNCSVTASVSISQPTLLTANTALISNVSCIGLSDGSASVTANGGTTPYTYAWDNGEITATAIGLNAGNHNVVVTDANNCSATASVSISQPTLLTANTALISNVSCNGATDGSASVTANGGTTPYTYAWDNGEITATAIGLNAGNHNVIVTDANNCSTTASVSISQPTLLTANTALISNVSCNGATDGSASVTANGGTTPYTYAWDNGEITATAIGLNAGNHNVIVTDANNCSVTASVSISQPTLLTANTALISNVSCNGATDGSASVTANGGTTPYTYAWDNGEITATAIGLNAGNHNVIVTDANNCSATASVSISQPTLLTANTALISNVSCIGLSDGSASVTANGGTAPYTYAWDNGEITATAIGLNAGNHNVVVTDANNCSATASVSISQPTLLTANTALISNVSCNGATDGSASVTANGGTTPYTYAWDNGEITATAIGLNAGNHNVIVIDANNCSATASVSISQPTLLTANTALISNVSCNGATDGSASVTANGGTTPYTYAWDNGEITATAIGLNAGNHNVIVTDANNCSATASVSISQPTLLTANTALISNVSCNGATDGSASVTANGGTTPYTYAWDNGEITATAIGLNAGNHNVIVTDANNCSATASVSISQPALLTANTALISNVSCNGATDGSASVTANGGTTPYTYVWDNGEITATAIGLNAGNHNVIVTDANNCSATASVSISQPTLLTANTALISNVSCNGATDGSASVTANGGTTPYTYAWDNGEITAIAIGLNAGNHNVIVTDANNCSATASVSISQPTLLTANTALISNVSCNGATDGSASVTANGGTTPYTYAWDNGEITATAIGLNAGNHNVVVTDANNCSATASVSISQPTLLTANTALISNVSCNGATDGSASVTANGGTTPYTYAWDNGEITATAIGLNAGNHNVIVTDANNCSATASVSISQPTLLTANTALISNVSCNGATDGSASVTANGGTTPYTYAWDNGEITATAIGLNAGNHNVIVTDANNCSATASVSISQPTLLTANTALISDVSCIGLSDGSASVTANGGTTPYTYAWDNGEITATAIGLNAGNHNVIVTDANNCSATASVSISQPTLLTANTALISNVSCSGATDGSASVTANGGTTPYTYAWDNGEITTTAIGLNAGNHNVVVTDANNCSTTATINITEPLVLANSISTNNNVSCNGLSDGSATVTANGGIAPYTYNWDSGSNSATANNLNAGNHFVTITDVNGCELIANVNITEPNLLIASTSLVSNISCIGENDGSATATGVGGTTPYGFIWDSGANMATATNLNAGNHIVTIIDALGCTATSTINITEPSALGLSINILQPISCSGGNDGSLQAVVTGGTGGYVYSWNHNPGLNNDTATGIFAGNYSVTVTDSNGCIAIDNVTVTQPNVLTVNVNALTDVVCFGEANGSAIATPQGGTAPYSYLWDNAEIIATAIGLDAGLHSVTITDNNNCIVIGSVVINEPTLLTVTINAVNVSCNGASDGSAIAIAQGGNGNYVYNWSNGGLGQTLGLPPGLYSVTVTDDLGCQATVSVTITEPQALTIISDAQDVSCFGYNDGRGTIFPMGGNPPYLYTWDNGEVSNPAISLTAGLHTVVITDANGCTYTESVAIGSPAQLTMNIMTVAPTCFGQMNGSATVTAIGGTAPYTYVWNSTPPQFGSTATGLPEGLVVLDITDANGCELQNINVTVGNAPQMLSLSVSGSDVTCWGGNDGTATVVATGGTASYSYQWNNGASGQTAFNLTAGTYTVTVTDASGCVDLISQSIGQPNQIAASFISTGTICFGEENGSITVIDTTIAGGNAPYSYSLNGEDYQMGNVFGGLVGGSYTLYVQDVNECVSTYQVLVDEPAELIVDLGADVVVELGDSTTMDVNETPSNIGVSYSWAPTDYLSCIDCETPTVTPLETTTYEVIITDTLTGCTAIDQITVIVNKNRNVYIPNGFTPNDDGTNDVFMIYGGTGVSTIRTFNVYDRWGELVWTAKNFQPNNPTYGWEGTFKGKRLNPAVFVYYAEIEFVDGEVILYNGDVTLLK